MTYSLNSGFGSMFSIVPLFVIVIFAVVVGILIWNGVRGARQWKRNNDSPILTVDASIVTKRENVSVHHNAAMPNAATPMFHSSTRYYVTFEVQSGDRMEFHVSGSEYGMLAEGDKGMLTFQGTRYIEFVRENRI